MNNVETRAIERIDTQYGAPMGRDPEAAFKLIVRVRRSGALGIPSTSFEFYGADHDDCYTKWEVFNRHTDYRWELMQLGGEEL